MGCSLPGSSVHGIFQAIVLEWIAISCSRGSSRPRERQGCGVANEVKVKEESEKVGLKLNVQKTKIMASGPITSWQIDGKTVETVLFLGAPKSLQMVTAAMTQRGHFQAASACRAAGTRLPAWRSYWASQPSARLVSRT